MPPHRRDLILITAIASIIAVIGARPYAGGWNDGSRLATVESLVDRGTFAVDDSIFVRVPPEHSPYPPGRDDLRRTGTLDKLRIDGRFYSDKSPVPALLLAGAYGVVQELTGLTARESPAAFCRLMNLFGGALPYVVAVVAVYLTALRVGLRPPQCRLLALSFAVATIAPAYARHVNNHVMLLSVAALATLVMTGALLPTHTRPLFPAEPGERGARARRRCWLALGALAGFGYTIDLGVGPAFLAAVGAFVAHQSWRNRSPRPLALFMLAALPWLAAHHAVNYAVAGVLGPSGAKAEYLRWPGSPFDEGGMTGRWQHAGPGAMLVYVLDLLVGQRGFLGHNLPLDLSLIGIPIAFRNRAARPVVAASLAWCGLAFLVYAAMSNNYAGLCLSIRWLLPTLAPGYLLLALLLRERPKLGRDLLLLTAFNAVTAAAGWWFGPWQRPPLTLYWPTLAAGLLAWGAYRLLRAGAPRHWFSRKFVFDLDRREEIHEPGAAVGRNQPVGNVGAQR